MQQTDSQQTDIIRLSEADKNYLVPYINQLEKLLVYETSLVKEILTSLDRKSQEIDRWKEELNDCLYSMNEPKFQKLIELARKT